MELPEPGKPLECGAWMLSAYHGTSGYMLWYEDTKVAAVFHDPALTRAVWMMIQAAHRPEAKE